MRNHSQSFDRTRQRGAILVVSLLLLLVMTVLALTASQTTRLQERMAGNARDLDLSFQSSEAGLRRSEILLGAAVRAAGGPTAIVPCPEADYDAEACNVVDRPDSVENRRDLSQDDWDKLSPDVGEVLEDVRSKPQFVTEEWVDVPDALTIGQSVQMSGTAYYVNTARSVGATDAAITVLETAFAVRH
jgi:type IV pilus assembly protein PilX